MRQFCLTFPVMRAYFILLLGITMIACESRLSQNRIPVAPVLDDNFLSNSLAALEKSLQQNPGNSELYFQKASLLYRLGGSGSEGAIDHALELNSEKPDYFFLKALIHRRAGQDSQALENAQQAERLGEARAELFELLAELHFEQSNYLETLNYSNQIIKANSGDSHPIWLKSKALMGLHDTVRAEYFLRKVLENDTNSVQAYILAIRIFMARSEYDTASTLLRKALALEPDNPELILQTGEWPSDRRRRAPRLRANRPRRVARSLASRRPLPQVESPFSLRPSSEWDGSRRICSERRH